MTTYVTTFKQTDTVHIALSIRMFSQLSCTKAVHQGVWWPMMIQSMSTGRDLCLTNNWLSAKPRQSLPIIHILMKTTRLKATFPKRPLNIFDEQFQEHLLSCWLMNHVQNCVSSPSSMPSSCTWNVMCASNIPQIRSETFVKHKIQQKNEQFPPL